MLKVREALIAVSSTYSDSASCGLADVIETLSGVATDLSTGADSTVDYESKFFIEEEPQSYDDALNKLPTFLARVDNSITKLSEPNALLLCELSVRSQTFASCLRR
jgi:hypothetical protein